MQIRYLSSRESKVGDKPREDAAASNAPVDKFSPDVAVDANHSAVDKGDSINARAADYISSSLNPSTGGAHASYGQSVLAHDEPLKQAATEVVATRPLVATEDNLYSTGFSFLLLSQMQPCEFTEADRLGKRKGLPHGFPGLACQHCYGGFGAGRFFPSSIKTLSDTSKTLNVLHNHMLRCRKCPLEIRELLQSLRLTHNDERAKLKFGSQKAFFSRIWRRLHGNTSGDEKRGKRVRDSDSVDDLSENSGLQPGSEAPTTSYAASFQLTESYLDVLEQARKRQREV
jgi:hypothetical protein